MSCSVAQIAPAWPVIAIVGLIVIGAILVRLAYWREYSSRTMRTADSAQIERDTRRVQASAFNTNGRPTTVRPAPPPMPRVARCDMQATIGAAARMAARADFVLVGRHRANPYTRHTAAAAWWALEYACEWETLAQQSRDRPGPPPAGSKP